jgi:hypothetical protein
MGERGPVGKRSGQRKGHRSKAEKAEAEKVPATGRVTVPEPSQEWHPIARDWYRSLGESGQSRFMEPSDWAAARYVAEVMTRNLTAETFSAALFAAVWSAMDSLLTTEGARRRVKVEVERGEPAPEEQAPVTQLDEYRQLLG